MLKFSDRPLKNVVAMICLIVSASCQSSEDTSAILPMLSKMSQSVRELNYRGFFSYENRGAISTFKIIHTVRNGVEYEQLESLSGHEWEIVRNGRKANCLSVGDQLLRSRILSPGNRWGNFVDQYHFYAQGDERVADRAATVVQLVPKDEYRYGYILSLDKSTGLPLKSLLIGNNKQVLERIQYIELDVGAALAEQNLLPSPVGHRIGEYQPATCNQSGRLQPRRWSATWLPTGFILAEQRLADNRNSMLMYTDGLATFSVFIKPAIGEALLEGRAQRGATVAFLFGLSNNQETLQATVIGEIPFATARRVATSIRAIP